MKMHQSVFVVSTLFFGAAATGSHRLQYLTVVSSQNATTTGQLDGETFVSYSSSDAEVILKTEWIKKIDGDVPNYWKSEKSRMSGDHLDLQYHLSRVEKLLHQTKGAPTLTRTYTCELSDDHTTRGSLQILYDGEDFIRLNLSTGTWTADNLQAEQFLKAWKKEAEYWTHYLKSGCIEWLKQYLTYSKNVNPDGGADEGSGGESSEGSGGGANGGSHKIIYIIAPVLVLFFVVALIVSYMKRERLQEFF